MVVDMIFDEICTVRSPVCLCFIASSLVFIYSKRLHLQSRESRIKKNTEALDQKCFEKQLLFETLGKLKAKKPGWCTFVEVSQLKLLIWFCLTIFWLCLTSKLRVWMLNFWEYSRSLLFKALVDSLSIFIPFAITNLKLEIHSA